MEIYCTIHLTKGYTNSLLQDGHIEFSESDKDTLKQ